MWMTFYCSSYFSFILCFSAVEYAYQIPVGLRLVPAISLESSVLCVRLMTTPPPVNSDTLRFFIWSSRSSYEETTKSLIQSFSSAERLRYLFRLQCSLLESSSLSCESYLGHALYIGQILSLREQIYISLVGFCDSYRIPELDRGLFLAENKLVRGMLIFFDRVRIFHCLFFPFCSCFVSLF